MTLLEMSVQYAERAAAIRERITMLRGMERQESDLETARSLRRRCRAAAAVAGGQRPGPPDGSLLRQENLK